MNETLVIIFAGLVAYIILQVCIVKDFEESSALRGITTILSLMVAIVLGAACVFFPLGYKWSEVRPATATRVGDELIINAGEWGNIRTTNIRYLDKPVQIRRIYQKNGFGWRMGPFFDYTRIEIVKDKNCER